jgi:hypothetical protein
MNIGRRVWLVLLVIVAALIVVDVVAPRLAGAVPRSPAIAALVVGAVFLYIVGTIVAANTRVRLRLPQLRKPRRLRPVRRDTDAASRFIDEFERKNRSRR